MPQLTGQLPIENTSIGQNILWSAYWAYSSGDRYLTVTVEHSPEFREAVNQLEENQLIERVNNALLTSPQAPRFFRITPKGIGVIRAQADNAAEFFSHA